MDRERQLMDEAVKINRMITGEKRDTATLFCDYELERIRRVYSVFCHDLYEFYKESRKANETIQIFQSAINNAEHVLGIVRNEYSNIFLQMLIQWRDAQLFDDACDSEPEEISFESEEIYQLFEAEEGEDEWPEMKDDGYHTLPKALKELYSSLFVERNDAQLSEAPEAVLWHINNDEAPPEDKVQWIDLFFADCMLPMEFTEPVWREKMTTLRMLLEVQRRLLEECKPCESAGVHTAAQNRRAYEAFLCWFAGDRVSFHEKMEEVLQITCEKAEKLFEEGREQDFLTYGLQQRFFGYLQGMDKAQEPLALIVEEAPSCGMAAEIHSYYSDYMNFVEARLPVSHRYSSAIRYQILARMRDLSTWAAEESEAGISEKGLSYPFARKKRIQKICFEDVEDKCRQRIEQMFDGRNLTHAS